MRGWWRKCTVGSSRDCRGKSSMRTIRRRGLREWIRAEGLAIVGGLSGQCHKVLGLLI